MAKKEKLRIEDILPVKISSGKVSPSTEIDCENRDEKGQNFFASKYASIPGAVCKQILGRKNTAIFCRIPQAISVLGVSIDGDLIIPKGAKGIVLFAHGSGSSRFSPRNKFIAAELNKAGLATLLIDLLTRDEEAEDALTGKLRFDIELLTERLIKATHWLRQNRTTEHLVVGYFGASTGAAAALVAAAKLGDVIGAVVSRGGRTDLAGSSINYVQAATLMIAGGMDYPIIEINKESLEKLKTEKNLVIVPGASHLFEEPGALEKVAELARDWFLEYLIPTEILPPY